MSEDEGRLDRIESKLDNVAEAVVALARVEERTVAIQELTTGLRSGLNALDARVRDLEKSSARRGGGLGVYERGFWVVLTAVIGTAITWFSGILPK